MKFVVFCFVLSAIVSSTVTIGRMECPPNSSEACEGCCLERTCQRRVVPCRPIRDCIYNPIAVNLCKLVCRCKRGYIKDALSDQCVLPTNCPTIPIISPTD
uniref:Uncharacterized protein LOC114328751 isoform X1 n=1 Tax=Diabrotica virgifera virgifera TaxID=50390 RepID=A0A6P7FKL3_DIAVI